MHDLHHHSLALEFPEHKDTIHTLKLNDALFKRLLGDYETLSKTIENIETEITPADASHEAALKMQRVHLKDTLYKLLVAA